MKRRLAFVILAPLVLLACGGSNLASATVAVIKSVAGGSTHALALKSDGSVWAWGQNDRAQLGDGSITDRHVPTAVHGLGHDAIAIAAGAGFSLALKSDGSVWAWGNNSRGQLGDGSKDPSLTPVRVKGLSGRFVAVAAGESFALALRSDGSLWSWGADFQGQLGDGGRDDTTTAKRVMGIDKPIAAIAAGFAHSLAIDRDGQLWAWGDNSSNELGVKTATSFQPMPITVTGLPGRVVGVAGGSFQSVAVMADGSVYAWGLEFSPEGDYVGFERPTKVEGLSQTLQVQAGWGFDLALEKDGSVWAWGERGEVLGAAAHGDVAKPIEVDGLAADVTAIWASWYNGYALSSNGALAAWGNNNQGQLGNGTVDPEGGSLLPVVVKRF